MAELLQRAHAGEDPDDLLLENWVDAEKTTDDEMGEDGISFDGGSAVILADVSEETAGGVVIDDDEEENA